MNEQIYERFAAIVKERYPAEEAMKITGMLYVAMQETLGGDIPLNEDFSDSELMKKYVASEDGRLYKRMTSMTTEDISRWGNKFDDKTAMMEAEGFKEVRKDDYPFVRLVINL